MAEPTRPGTCAAGMGHLENLRPLAACRLCWPYVKVVLDGSTANGPWKSLRRQRLAFFASSSRSIIRNGREPLRRRSRTRMPPRICCAGTGWRVGGVSDQTRPLYRAGGGRVDDPSAFVRQGKRKATTALRRLLAACVTRRGAGSLPSPSPLHLPEQLSCSVADGQFRLRPVDERELMISAVGQKVASRSSTDLIPMGWLAQSDPPGMQ